MDDDYEDLIRNGHVLVYEIKEGITAAYVRFFYDDYVLLDNCAILPAHQNKGISQEIFEIVREEAKARNINRFRLYTHAKMLKNIKIYEHLGFVVTERKTEKGFDRVYMETTSETYRGGS